ncbi:MAG: nitric oxide-sensing protein NosP [Rhodothermales bacterium]
MLNVKMGASNSLDPVVAVKELFDAIDQPQSSFVLFYCTSEYDLDALGAELNRSFGNANLIGCTSAGEISSAGYNKGTLIGLSVASEDFTVVTERMDNLSDFQLTDGEVTTSKLTKQLKALGKAPVSEHTFGFLLIDGLSSQEEVVVDALHRNLNNIQLFGGSAADGDRFEKTYIYHDGAFRSNSAIFSLIHTTHPFTIFKTEHFDRDEEEIVVTEADISSRVVSEINGLPAAHEYARVMGVDNVGELTATMFATHPVAVSIGGENFVRSIMKVNEDETISFACAIDEGIVLSVAKANDLIENLENAMEDLRNKIGTPQLVLGCDCLFRMLEMEQKSIKDEVGRILSENNVFAFSTYGEQYNGMHVNQTFTGVAIGA